MTLARKLGRTSYPLNPPTRLTGLTTDHARKPLYLTRSVPMQYPTIIEHNRFALFQLMRIHGSGRLDELGEG